MALGNYITHMIPVLNKSLTAKEMFNLALVNKTLFCIVSPAICANLLLSKSLEFISHGTKIQAIALGNHPPSPPPIPS